MSNVCAWAAKKELQQGICHFLSSERRREASHTVLHPSSVPVSPLTHRKPHIHGQSAGPALYIHSTSATTVDQGSLHHFLFWFFLPKLAERGPGPPLTNTVHSCPVLLSSPSRSFSLFLLIRLLHIRMHAAATTPRLLHGPFFFLFSQMSARRGGGVYVLFALCFPCSQTPLPPPQAPTPNPLREASGRSKAESVRRYLGDRALAAIGVPWKRSGQDTGSVRAPRKWNAVWQGRGWGGGN